MEIMEAVRNRHAVRAYTDQKLEREKIAGLQAEIDACNRESGLHIQLVTDEPRAFGGLMAHYGKFDNVQNYVALVGEKGADLEEKIGYYGERVALKAQQLGLNTCWVAMTFSKGKCGCAVGRRERLVCVLSLGYGKTQGTPHRSKPMESLCAAQGIMPDWFKRGMEAALLAPTAMNQQKFLFTLDGRTVAARATGGVYSKVDLGIVKYHFELGAGVENFLWRAAER